MSEPFIIRYITFDTLKLVDQDGQFRNSIKTFEAQKIAKEYGLDLVCFNKPNGTDLAFCKIIDFNKWKYEEEKKKKKQAKGSRRDNKEMRFSPGIADNDIEHKMRQVNEFLDEGDEVTLVMKLRGRERLHMADAEIKMNEIVKKCDGHGKENFRKKLENIIIVRVVKSK